MRSEAACGRAWIQQGPGGQQAAFYEGEIIIAWFQSILNRRRQFVLWFFSYLLVAVVSVSVNLIGYYRAIRTIEEEVANVNSGAMTQMRIMYDHYFQEIESNSYQLINSNSVQALASSTITPQREVDLLLETINSINLCNSQKDWIETTQIIFQDKDICIDETGKYSKDLLYELKYSNCYSSRNAWISDIFIPELKTFRVVQDTNGNQKFFSIYTSPQLGKKPVVVLTEINSRVISHYLSQLTESAGGNAFLADAGGRVLFSAEPAGELSLQFAEGKGTELRDWNGRKYVVNYQKSGVLKDIWYAQMTENNDYIGKIKSTRNIFLLSFTLCMLCGVGLAYLFSRVNYRPVKRLLHMVGGEQTLPFYPSQGEFGYIEEMVNAMNKDRSRIEKEMSSQRNTILSVFLFKLLSGKVEINERVRQYLLSEYAVDLSGSNFAVVLFNIMELGLVDDESNTTDWEGYKMAHFVISNIFAELMAPAANVYFCEADDMYAAIVSFNGDVKSNTFIAEKAEYANQFLREHLQLEFVCGISSVSVELKSLPALYQQAYEMITYRFLTEGTHTFIYNEVMSRPDVYQYTPEMVERLTSQIVSGNAEQAEAYIRYVVDANLSSRKMNLDMLRILAAELTSTILKQTVELASDRKPDIRAFCRLSSELTDMGRVPELVDKICAFTRQLCELYADNTRQTVDSRCENIKAYIKEHYQDQNLNVGSVASAFGLSMSYLSYYFKEQMGEGLAEYIVKFRVEKAKEFLSGTDDTIAAIAEKAGFCSSNVFIRAFKKVTAVTPGQYKNMNKK